MRSSSAVRGERPAARFNARQEQISMSPNASKRAQTRQAVLAAALAAGAALAVFLPAVNNDFVGLDDDVYITANPLIAPLTGRTLWAILTRPYAEFYHPVTLLSLAFDHWVWGGAATGFHLTDVVLHAMNAALVFWVCYLLVRCARRRKESSAAPEMETGAGGTEATARTAALVAAALFALHPLRVESVAWAAQRKDVLYAFFFLLSVGCYVRHAENAAVRSSRLWYRLSLAAFVLSLLSKSMAMTLPLVLVLLDYYPLGRLRSAPRRPLPPDARAVWTEKLPFVGLALAFALVTLAAQAGGGSIRSAAEIPWHLRPWIAVHSYAFYLLKTLLPTDLTVLYPIPLTAGAGNLYSWISLIALAGVTAAVWLLRRRWPAALAVWLYYLITLAPVCGLLTFGAQSVADRYSYLPTVGFALLVGWLVARVNEICDEGWRPVLRALAGGAVAVAVLGLAHETRLQIGHWHNAETLWTRHLEIYPTSTRGRFNLAYYYHTHHRPPEAIRHYELCLLESPNHFDANINLGSLFLKRRYPEGARECFEKAVAARPDHAGARYNLALALVRLDERPAAIEQLKEAVRLAPDFAEAHAALGEAYAESGMIGPAIRQYREALKINPRMAETHESLGLAYLAIGQKNLARTEFERALHLNPRLPASLIELGRFDVESSRPLTALSRFSQAARLQPNDADIHVLKAHVVLAQGAYGLAESSLRQAVEIDPAHKQAWFELGLLLEQRDRPEEAFEALRRARDLFDDATSSAPAALLEALERVHDRLDAEGEK
ncbi:MAG: tetratricopeptide repeat protein [Candidatus Sumerlaeia bacterium]|nr:tetratricopeptide repeat protein [Candidatus Sumerlaeia bacterium]